MVANKILLENYNALAKIPFVKRAIKRVNVLDKENKDLVSENKTLKKVIEMLTNKQPHCCCSHSNDVPFKPNEKVYIKQEKMTIDELSTSSSHGKNNDINITYEIVSDNGALQDSQIVYGDDGETTWRTEISQKLPILSNIENTIELTDDLPSDTTSIVSQESEEVEVEDSEEEEVEVEESEEEEVEVEESEEEEVEVEVEESEEEEVEVEVEESEEEEDEEEAYEVTIKKKLYYTTNEIDGIIYSIDKDDEIGDEVGHFKNGKPVFNKKK